MKQVIVYGPPCSGKSTYVMDHIQEGDFRYDYDALELAITNRTEHCAGKTRAMGMLMAFRETFLEKTAGMEDDHTAWVIASRRTETLEQQAGREAEWIEMDTPMEVCLERLANDSARPDKDRWETIIRNYFAEKDKKEEPMGKTIEIYLTKAIEPDEEIFNWQTGQMETVESDTSQNHFIKLLAQADARDTVMLYINSIGGDVKEALGIFNALKRCQAQVIAHIDGFACSAASVIAMGADEIIMPRNTCMMIHNAAWWTYGNARELRKSADDLETLNSSIINSYIMRAGDKLPAAQLRRMLDNETWISAEDCVKYGLADRLDEQEADLTAASNQIVSVANSSKAAEYRRPAAAIADKIRAVCGNSKISADWQSVNSGFVVSQEAIHFAMPAMTLDTTQPDCACWAPPTFVGGMPPAPQAAASGASPLPAGPQGAANPQEPEKERNPRSMLDILLKI